MAKAAKNELSEDELELERLVFGDISEIQERVKGTTLEEDIPGRTRLEDLEDDQVRILLL
jgi:hypothetical protein